MIQYPIINPVAIKLGFLSIRWYSLAYIFGFLLGFWLIKKKLETLLASKKDSAYDFITIVMVGVIIGGRLGYCIFYNPLHYLHHPFEMIQVWTGGMSYHGGAIGALISSLIFARVHRLNKWKILDLLAYGSTVGLGLGRIANFINAELYGRATTHPWAMVFPGSDGAPRHPSQLYEAFGEGFLLWALLFILQKKQPTSGIMFSSYLVGYGVIRFLIEFTREPDAHIGLFIALSRGQFLCMIMIAIGAMCFMLIQRERG